MNPDNVIRREHLNVRMYNAVTSRMKITDYNDLSYYSREVFARIPNVGAKSLLELEKQMRKRKITFRPHSEYLKDTEVHSDSIERIKERLREISHALTQILDSRIDTYRLMEAGLMEDKQDDMARFIAQLDNRRDELQFESGLLQTEKYDLMKQEFYLHLQKDRTNEPR